MQDQYYKEIWLKTKEQLQIDLKPLFYQKFIEGLEFVAGSEQGILLDADNEQLKSHVEQRYLEDINRVLAMISGRSIPARFAQVKDRLRQSEEASVPNQQINPIYIAQQERPELRYFDEGKLNPRYHFGDFVRGTCNELPYQACQVILDNPGTAYNPLYIFGKPGMGKTHLLQATANEIKKNRPWLRIVCVQLDTFQSLWVQAIKSNTIESFKTRIRAVDVLLIDDIHALSQNSVNTGEELFNTFNHLHALNKQILLTSDRTPAELQIEERLKSRFGWGLITELAPPDFETRKAIIELKSQRMGIALSAEVTDYLALKITDNIRFIESSLNKLHASSKLLHHAIDLQLARNVVRDLQLSHERNSAVSLDQILKAVAKHAGITESDILGKTRFKSVTTARHLGMYLAVKYCQISKREIAQKFGRNDHSTVINAEKNVHDLIKSDADFQNLVEEVIHELKLG